jgi:hypothetical protein
MMWSSYLAVMNLAQSVGEWAIRIALITCFLELGGSLYEYIVVDRAWPANVALIQPAQGGLDRKAFWMPLHLGLTLALLVALWASLGQRDVRFWLLVSLAVYVVMRAWTFAYFVPVVMEFEAGRTADLGRARTWVRLSLLRLPLLLAATYALYRAWEKLGRPSLKGG